MRSNLRLPVGRIHISPTGRISTTADLIAKAYQYSMFGPRGEVQKPGSKGGKFYRTEESGKVKYGDKPTPKPKGGDRENQRAALGACPSRDGAPGDPHSFEKGKCVFCGMGDPRGKPSRETEKPAEAKKPALSGAERDARMAELKEGGRRDLAKRQAEGQSRAKNACPSRDGAPGDPHVFEKGKCVFCGTGEGKPDYTDQRAAMNEAAGGQRLSPEKFRELDKRGAFDDEGVPAGEGKPRDAKTEETRKWLANRKAEEGRSAGNDRAGQKARREDTSMAVTGQRIAAARLHESGAAAREDHPSKAKTMDGETWKEPKGEHPLNKLEGKPGMAPADESTEDREKRVKQASTPPTERESGGKLRGVDESGEFLVLDGKGQGVGVSDAIGTAHSEAKKIGGSVIYNRGRRAGETIKGPPTNTADDPKPEERRGSIFSRVGNYDASVEKKAAAKETAKHPLDKLEGGKASKGDTEMLRRADAAKPDAGRSAAYSSTGVAQTIMAQVGRHALTMMGAKQFVGGGKALHFSIGQNPKRVSKVQIELADDDTYDVTTYSGRGLKMSKLAGKEGVHFDQLRPILKEMTGLDMSLGVGGNTKPLYDPETTPGSTPKTPVRDDWAAMNKRSREKAKTPTHPLDKLEGKGEVKDPEPEKAPPARPGDKGASPYSDEAEEAERDRDQDEKEETDRAMSKRAAYKRQGAAPPKATAEQLQQWIKQLKRDIARGKYDEISASSVESSIEELREQLAEMQKGGGEG